MSCKQWERPSFPARTYPDCLKPLHPGTFLPTSGWASSTCPCDSTAKLPLVRWQPPVHRSQLVRELKSACHHQPCLHRSNSFRIHQHSSMDSVSLQCALTLATGSGLLCLPTPTEGRSPGWLSKSQLLLARGTEGTMARTTLNKIDKNGKKIITFKKQLVLPFVSSLTFWLCTYKKTKQNKTQKPTSLF